MCIIVCSKTPAPFSRQAPLKLANCQSSPVLGNPLLYIGFSWTPPKSWIFQWTPIPSYLLKVTKFLSKVSQFEFLVMTEKSIFAHKLFLSLNISDFNLFFMWKLQAPPPPEKVAPSKSWGPVKPLFLKIWSEVQPPCRKRGAHYVHIYIYI